MTLKEMAEKIHQTAVDHGWWEQDRNVGEMYMLMGTELAEAYEEWRDGKPEIYFNPGSSKPEGEGIELADLIIRVLDYAHHKGFDLELMILTKMEYNETRPYRHGGKRS